ncbi:MULTISPECIES: HAD-IIA family hydrolase [unclassified Cryobacterium]|uniref:HAD-IIA family hydrolase n=1 Tax=unclassified Cryobacterium TaxID=2649013 RepID=UPI001E4EA3F9|nr:MULTISPECIES: HAD-IIA family hydrolase [unclassified Cryobacterium]
MSESITTREESGPPTGDTAARALPERVYDAYLFDLDGTIYLGEELLPGAFQLLEHLRQMKRRVVFLSNNPTLDRTMYVSKLTKLGIQVTPEEVVNSVVSMVAWLSREHPGKIVYPIAEQPLITALRDAGIPTSSNPDKIDIVLASYDRGFDYSKLQIAFDSLWKRDAILVATNLDRYCPFPGGRGEPDAAAIVAAIEACTGAACVANAGKPSVIMLETVMAALGLRPQQCLMTGDRLYTDVKMAVDAGMDSALVLTGDADLDSVASTAAADQPTYILDRVDHVIPAAVRHQLGWSDVPSESLAVGLRNA